MHPTDDELILHYYGELEAPAAADTSRHLQDCPACHASFTRLQRVLAAVDGAPAPALPEGFERIVWARLQPELTRKPGWTRWFGVPPARFAWVAGIAVLVVAAFVAGRVSQKGPVVAPPAQMAGDGLRERVLLADLGDHLDRSQMMLVELVTAGTASDLDLPSERIRAEQLISNNRLYRQTAAATGNAALADVLDELEQVLVDVATSPDTLSAADLTDVRQRIENKGLLLKVRVLSSQVQKRQRSEIRMRAGQSS